LVETLLKKVLRLAQLHEATEAIPELLETLSIAETIAAMAAIAILENQFAMGKDLVAGSRKSLVTMDWESHGGIYVSGLSAHHLQRLEWLKQRLQHEMLVEGKYVTPFWYQAELIDQVSAELFVETTKALVFRAAEMFKAAIEAAIRANRPWLAGAIVSREFEYWNKLSLQRKGWQVTWDSLISKKKIEGLTWVDFDAAEADVAMNRRSEELMGVAAKLAILLSQSTRPDSFPDYAGQFLHATGEAVFKAMAENNLSLLIAIFPPYLVGTCTRFDRLRPPKVLEQWRATQEFKVAASPLMDLMDICGYAKVFSEVHKNPGIWDLIVEKLDEFMSQPPDGSRINLFAMAVLVSEMDFEIPHRAVLRTSWRMAVTRNLSQLPQQRLTGRRGEFGGTCADHPSELIRELSSGHYGISHDGIDVFISYYVREVPDGAAVNFGGKRRDMRRGQKRTNGEVA